MPFSKDLIQNLLASAGVTVNGNKPWDIQVHNAAFFQSLYQDTDLALGESYIKKWWDCPRIDEFIYRILSADLEKKALTHPQFWRAALHKYSFRLFQLLFNSQTKEKALLVGKRHYDIGNDLYQCMLDKRMVYTCGFWHGVNNLDAAQEQKLRITCQKLHLTPGMRLLDIGCGFGSLAKYAAQHYGVSVVGITISQQQLALGQQLCAGLPIELRFQDYRDLVHSAEKFDRVVSLGMFEHVGFKNYAQYMNAVAHCLKEEGIFLLHTIGANLSNKTPNRYINTYIFPNGQIPSVARIASAIEGVFIMENWENYGVNYDKTLLAWYDNFNQNWEKLKDKYSEDFRRMWNYYLLSCAGSFRARNNQLWQIVLTKKGLKEGYSYSL